VKRASFSVVALAVFCPHCESEQPSPGNGSDMWEPAEVVDEERRTCVSCDERFTIVRPSRVAMPTTGRVIS